MRISRRSRSIASPHAGSGDREAGGVPEIVGHGSGAFEDGMKRYMAISQVNKAKTLLLVLTLFAKVGRWY